MREVNELVIVTAPLRDDREHRRWYGSNGRVCLVLTTRRLLLEPHPTFGPTEYRVLARDVSVRDANGYAFAHRFTRGKDGQDVYSAPDVREPRPQANRPGKTFERVHGGNNPEGACT